MKLHKRIVAGISAFVMLMSVPLNSGFITVAEEAVPTVTEIQTDDNNGTLESTTTTTTTTSAVVTTAITDIQTTTTETTTETTTTTTKDTSPPTLTVTLTDHDKWLNEEGVAKWKVEAEDATIYYKTYEMNPETENSDINTGYVPEDAKKWNNTSVNDMQEGSGFIVFWAAYSDSDCEVAVSDAYEYHLDKSEPEPFELSTDTEKDGSINYLVISDENGVSDRFSGIAKISYRVDDGLYNNLTTELSTEQMKYDTNHNIIGFTLKIDNYFKNAKITVYVEDKVGKVREQEIGGITHDPSIPEITGIYITDSHEQGATILECLTFGHEALNNFENHIFANNNYYLAVTVIDDNLNEILVTVNEVSAVLIKSCAVAFTPTTTL